MNRNLKNMAKAQKPISPWIKFCGIAGLVLLLIAGTLYAYRYMRLDREFHHNIKTFGEDTYKEIFSLQDSEKTAEPILAKAEEAFSFVGTEADATAQFGLLSRYSCTDPNAVSEKHTLDYIASHIEENTGYIWVAYSQAALDPVGEAISASGSDKMRILSRWTVARRGSGDWVVTKIVEGP